MNLKKLMNDIQAHPIVIAIVIFGILFLYFNVFKKSSSATATAGTTSLPPGTYIDPTTGAVSAQPQSQEVYQQAFNSYPTGGTSATATATATVPTPTPTPAPVTTTTTTPTGQKTIGTVWTLPNQPNWQVVGGSVGNPLVPYGSTSKPSGITGQVYNYGGQTYTQVAGSGGRIWGVPGNMSAAAAIGSQTKELLYAPSSYYSS